MKYSMGFFFLVFCFASNKGAPAKASGDRAVYIETKNHHREKLMKYFNGDQAGEIPLEKTLRMDVSGKDLPRSVEEFKSIWHTPSHCQGLTGSCWSFSSTSFFESEVSRLSGRNIRLSEMYPVYWEYVEKARRFVREKGDSRFSRGSQPNAMIRMCRLHGAVPFESYPGKPSSRKYYESRKLFGEMEKYLDSVKEAGEWNEDKVIREIRSILDRHLGPPPDHITVEGKQMTPSEYFSRVLRLNPDDYLDVMSLREKPWHRKVEYEVADNWWHSEDYYNVPLEDFIRIVKYAVRNGSSVCIVGDNSESGFIPEKDVALIPTYDIPSEAITDDARQLRFSTGATSDDHAIHIVGFLEKNGKDWYLIKDSGTRAQNGNVKGYMFYHEDFVKLKMMNMLVHRGIVEKALGRPVPRK